MKFSLTVSFFLLALEAAVSQSVLKEDFVRELQRTAAESNEAQWGHWGDRPNRYSSWTYHSNRLVPLYSFGITLEKYTGVNSSYRSEEMLEEIYGRMPAQTLNEHATYMDQTEIYFLQKAAVEAGKKQIVLIIFDGMEWQTTLAASIYKNGKVLYDEGYGTGLAFLDYDKCKTRDKADVVCSPHNSGTKADVDTQSVTNIGGDKLGGYSAEYGGSYSWSRATSDTYLLGKLRTLGHVVTDSAASATSMNSGIKTFNSAINVDPDGNQVTPIARELQASGYKIGVVSSVPISHATPACAYANNVTRNDYQDLTRDLIGRPSVAHRSPPLSGVDVLIGCGWGEDKADDRKKQGKNYVPGNKYLTANDLAAIDAKNGGRYQIAQRTSGKKGRRVLNRAANKAVENGQRLFGFFGHTGGHLPYQTADGNYNPTRGVNDADRYTPDEVAENPTLAEMTKAALKVLGENQESRFWLMIEAGDVDWANHNNNIDDSIGAVLSGEAAFEVATQWIEKNSSWNDAAVIVTADHGHYLVLDSPEVLTGRTQQKEVGTEYEANQK